MKQRISRWLLKLAHWISRDDLQAHAADVVRWIEKDDRMRAVVQREGNIAFCPRCGQLPVADYRREEAFQMILARFPDARRSDINLAIELEHRKLK